MVRVLVAEDSVTVRELLSAILCSEPGIEVVAHASTGTEAVALAARLRPDVITMDIRMPRMDGFAATKEIMRATPTPIIIVSGTVDDGDVEVSLQALRMGAAAVLPKPYDPRASGFDAQCREMVETVKAMNGLKVVRHSPCRSHPGCATAEGWLDRPGRVDAVALAASTGGPAALARVLGDLPGDFPVPVLVVQHIAADFHDAFVRWLARSCALQVRSCQEGERLVGGSVYVAPSNCHFGIGSRAAAAFSFEPPVNGFRPSADKLFESLAATLGAHALAVVLTGMGKDGLRGARRIVERGGVVLAQDADTSVVFGMPGAVANEGLAARVLPLPLISQQLMRMV